MAFGTVDAFASHHTPSHWKSRLQINWRGKKKSLESFNQWEERCEVSYEKECLSELAEIDHNYWYWPCLDLNMDYQGDVIWSVKLVMRVFDYVFFFNLCLLVILKAMYTSLTWLSSFCGESLTQWKLYFFYMSSHDHNPNICSSQGAEKNGRNDKCETICNYVSLSLFFKSTSG